MLIFIVNNGKEDKKRAEAAGEAARMDKGGCSAAVRQAKGGAEEPARKESLPESENKGACVRLEPYDGCAEAMEDVRRCEAALCRTYIRAALTALRYGCMDGVAAYHGNAVAMCGEDVKMMAEVNLRIGKALFREKKYGEAKMYLLNYIENRNAMFSEAFNSEKQYTVCEDDVYVSAAMGEILVSEKDYYEAYTYYHDAAVMAKDAFGHGEWVCNEYYNAATALSYCGRDHDSAMREEYNTAATECVEYARICKGQNNERTAARMYHMAYDISRMLYSENSVAAANIWNEFNGGRSTPQA